MTYFGNKTAQNLDHIKNNPLAVCVTLLTIYWGVLTSNIDVGPITLWEIFKMMCTGTTVDKFNNILFKVSGKTFEFIREDYNRKICLADQNSEEVKV